MQRNATFFENGFDLIPDQISVDWNTANTEDYVNCELYDRFYLVILKPAGTAGDDIKVTFNQATDAAGTGAKAASIATAVWHKVAATTSMTTWTAVDSRSAPASSIDFGDSSSITGDIGADDTAAIIVVECMTELMDTNNNFSFLTYNQDEDAIGNAMTASAFWIAAGSGYPRNVPPSALS